MPHRKAAKATPVDLQVGQNVRDIRLSQGLTQGQLGSVVGVTYQQIQKYECGQNRIGSSRLAMIAEALGVPTQALFAEAVGRANSGENQGGARQELFSREMMQLARAYIGIASPVKRKAVLKLLHVLAAAEEDPTLGAILDPSPATARALTPVILLDS